MNKNLLTVVLLLLSLRVMAVHVNDRGLGEVLIYPYYTVNNYLNTMYTVVNTTEQAKAIKVSFHEGDAGLHVLTFHVYLSPYDVWSGALVPTESTIVGHLDEPTAVHVTPDTSCAPYLNKAGQEFLPYVIDEDLNPANRSLARATEGYMQVMELGELTGNAVAFVDHGGVGVPANCTAIQAAWDTLDWALEEPTEPQGGLLGSAFIINVAEGLSMSYDAIALNDFWDGQGVFTDPGSLLPDLSSGTAESKVLLADGTLAVSQWSSGIEAVSAVLMKAELYNEYAYDAFVNGKSEWVVSFPTKTLHTNTEGPALAPFSQAWDGVQSCDEYTAMLYDRETATSHQYQCCADPPPPPPEDPQLCLTTNVIEMLPPYTAANEVSAILGSDNLSEPATYFDSRVTENGWGVLSFPASPGMVPVNGTGFRGLPATGFMVQQFSNGGAGEGLLAQYANLFIHKGRVAVMEAE
ncbi:hypothetical protein ACFODZ_09845 [Marinicella sediminis]|uniref:Uncharacterized protein n=1 Tax=Marinicella sediminis TaxID=1792834 RepID=A0ABV7J8R8_9GAMM|nr:hypothetical protein [Marinicella sediminis]